MIMKKLIVSLACCALVAPLAFGKDTKKMSKKATHIAVLSSESAVTVTAPDNTKRMEYGEVSGYQPAGTVIVRQDGAGRYVLDEPGRIVNRRGEIVSGQLRAGTRVRVFFTGDNGSKTLDHIVVY
jgi:hypothetical protein